MSLDLVLLPVTYTDANGTCTAYTRLKITRDDGLFEQIKALPSKQIEGTLYGHMGDTLCSRTTDCYNEPLRYVEAGEFFSVRPSLFSENFAALGYIRMLMPDTKVFLFWY